MDRKKLRNQAILFISMNNLIYLFIDFFKRVICNGNCNITAFSHEKFRVEIRKKIKW